MDLSAATLAEVERKREQRAWYFYDWANSAFASTVLTLFLGPYLTAIARAAAYRRSGPPLRPQH
jgi:MFS-type transporter involved in bile tolerance (Atg22 family)